YNITCEKGGYATQFKSSVLRIESDPQINSNATIPATPLYKENLIITANITDEDNNIIQVNFTLKNPSGINVIDHENGTNAGDIWNSSAYLLNESGTWQWWINVTDADGRTASDSGSFFAFANCTYSQFNLSDSHGQRDSILNPSETYNATVKIQEYNNVSYFDVYSGNFSIEIGGINYSLVHIGDSIWHTNESFTAPSGLEEYSFLANITGTSDNAVSGSQNDNNYTYYVKNISASIYLDKSVYNPQENVTVSGKAVLNPDSANVSNNSIKLWLDEEMLGLYVPALNGIWKYRKNIIIDYTKVNGIQIDFPLLINITDTDLTDHAQSDGDDIAFTDSGGSKLDHEIEFYNSTTGWLVAWVRIPTLSNTTDTVINIYYGNSNASNQQNVTGVWDSNFVMVQHLQETDIDGGAGDIKDSTKYVNNGTTVNMNTADQVPGLIGGSFDFDGSNDYINCGNDPSVRITSAITVSAWMKSSSLNTWSTLVAKGHGETYVLNAGINGNYVGMFRIWDSNTEYGDSNTGLNLADNQWHFVVGTYDGSLIQIYGDGNAYTAPGSHVGDIDSTADNLLIGYDSGSSNELAKGFIDEVRISNTARSAGWIATEYNNQFNPDSFYSVSSEQAATTTDSDGNYNYTFTAPDSANLGQHTVKINLTDPNGIYAENQTTFEVWAPAKVNYTTTTDYTKGENTEYNIT
ncbi:MAG: DUF2341 domain-containing protein, partial [Candidatus Aenigmarchaeota archaeon]|nr:DUF2341 domain-containing protein [Candidatus Aenigmarchaeota archaeon]